MVDELLQRMEDKLNETSRAEWFICNLRAEKVKWCIYGVVRVQAQQKGLSVTI